jgi:hypothetical protein
LRAVQRAKFAKLTLAAFLVLSTMTTIIAFSLSRWFSDALGELTRYFSHLNSTQWAILSASAVAFGFMCLKGQSLRN